LQVAFWCASVQQAATPGSMEAQAHKRRRREWRHSVNPSAYISRKGKY